MEPHAEERTKLLALPEIEFCLCSFCQPFAFGLNEPLEFAEAAPGMLEAPQLLELVGFHRQERLLAR